MAPLFLLTEGRAETVLRGVFIPTEFDELSFWVVLSRGVSLWGGDTKARDAVDAC